jgi:lipid II:glycine glycyltransferase (peptidoglycan interpeptide bridge formation enzyme)
MKFLILYLQATLERKEWKFLEVRPVNMDFGQKEDGAGFAPASSYFLHKLDLRPDLDVVFRSLGKNSVQRRFNRAQQSGLVEKCGTSDDLLKEFYRLLVITRRRHRIPPPSYSWFRNLIACEGGALEIRVAYQSETPIAAILTLRFRKIVYYKYGCSDVRFNKSGATTWLLWNAIAAAKANGANEFDMGRTEKNNAGLVAFKNHFVPHPSELVYWRFPETSYSFDRADGWRLKLAKRAFALMPSPLLTMAGKLLYRHIG